MTVWNAPSDRAKKPVSMMFCLRAGSGSHSRLPHRFSYAQYDHTRLCWYFSTSRRIASSWIAAEGRRAGELLQRDRVDHVVDLVADGGGLELLDDVPVLPVVERLERRVDEAAGERERDLVHFVDRVDVRAVRAAQRRDGDVEQLVGRLRLRLLLLELLPALAH